MSTGKALIISVDVRPSTAYAKVSPSLLVLDYLSGSLRKTVMTPTPTQPAYAVTPTLVMTLKGHEKSSSKPCPIFRTTSEWSAYPLTGPLGDGICRRVRRSRRREMFVSMGCMHWQYQGVADGSSLLVQIVITGRLEACEVETGIVKKISRPFRNDHPRRYLRRPHATGGHGAWILANS